MILSRPVPLTLLLTLCFVAPLARLHSADNLKTADDATYDVVIYGGTSAGIAAAIQVKRMGGTVVVIEPSRRIGGLTTGGLGQTDIGNKAAIGGIAREFYQLVRKHYDQPQNWKWQSRQEYTDSGQSRTGANEDTMWTFEPSAALAIMQDLVREHKIPVVLEQRIDRTLTSQVDRRVRGVIMKGKRIVGIETEDGQSYRGRVYLDATYEGDLLAGAGISYIVGREGNDVYDETLNGVQTQHAIYHQFVDGVDPYITAGDAASGLLPGIDSNGPGIEGTGDHRVQAFCFRMCLTDHPDNRIPFAKPASYDPLVFEALLRNFEAGEKGMPWINSGMPNRKTDTNNRLAFSTDFIGQNYDYPEASYTQRDTIAAQHRQYQQGLMWTLANDPRVPEHIRHEVARWGTCRDEFEGSDGWQEQLYVREARRMVGAAVMTQHHCQGDEIVSDAIGMAAYTMDSHNVQRYVDSQGQLKNEGDVQVGGFSPYPISYAALTPQAAQCDNLLAPVCLSASHIAFGSIRMEPVFMVLGQSAATAAMLAVKSDIAVQDVSYASLKDQLLGDDQVLSWSGPVRKPSVRLAAGSFTGIVVDDEKATRTGFDSRSQAIGPVVGLGYRHDGNTDKGFQAIRFSFDIEQAGTYELRMAYAANANRATNVPLHIHIGDTSRTVHVNQRLPAKHPPFASIATFDFPAGKVVFELTNADTDGFVVIDAIQLVPLSDTLQ